MMDGEPARNSEAEPLRLARAVRFAVVAIVIAASIPSLHASLSIGKFMAVFSDMFGARGELPLITKMVFNARPAFWFVSIVVPVGAFATLRMRDVAQSFYFLGALVFVTTAQFVILYYSITAPLAALARRF